MERAVIEYAVNAFWQFPLLAAGAWLLLRMMKPSPAAQYRVWLVVLGLAVVLPLYGTVHGNARSSVPVRGVVDSPATSPNGFSAVAFDTVGEPGGLVLGQRKGTNTSGFSLRALTGQVRTVRLNATAARWIAVLYLAIVLVGIFRLMRAWRAARRLVRESRESVLTDRESAALDDSARRFGIQAPQVRVSGGISGPVVVGAAKPVLLWPENFGLGASCDGATLHSEDEVMAAMCHEMAHAAGGRI